MAEKKKKEVKIEHVVCSVVATDDGYYKGRIVKTGEKFVYEGILKDGKFPLWMNKIGTPKIRKEAPKPVVEKVDEELAQAQAEIADLV